ncbi:MAG: 50S ribosomal protein L17 [Flavobacteriaceae bacterium]|nr:50S ribosomal protein L17 [Flavobacteriaceae bacterium]|tara:strand:+ start:396 stop:983 length:588 start_codon:yes stop_codon:yes gene_type:complete
MKHGKKGNHLGRKVAHRKSMLANMACSLIEHKRINTTVAKAKALKQFVEPLITKSKTDSTHNRRLAFSALRNKYAVSELFRDVAQKVGDRPGGYTRVIKMGNRLGDNADMAMIELVDFNTVYNTDKGEAKKTTRRSRSRKKLGIAGTPEAQAETPAAEVTEIAAAPAPKASQPEEKKSEEETDDKSSKTDENKDA